MTIDDQIRRSFEQGCTPEQIANDQGLDVVAVKAKLIQVSKLYREKMGMEEEEIEDGLNFTKDQLKQANDVIVETMLAACDRDGNVDFKTRLSAAMYVRDDKKGRKEVKQLLQQNQFNIFDFNKALEASRNGANKVKEMLNITPKTT